MCNFNHLVQLIKGTFKPDQYLFKIKIDVFHIYFIDQYFFKVKIKLVFHLYLINFDLLPIGIDGQGLTFAALAGLDFPDDNCALETIKKNLKKKHNLKTV